MNMRYAKRSEDTEQINVVSWAGWNMSRYPELKWLFHVPNGGSRNKQEAVKFKQMGVKAGVSDLCLPYPKGIYCGLFIEMKYGNNRQQDTQKSLGTNEKYNALQIGLENTIMFETRACDKMEEIRLNLKEFYAVYKGVEFKIYDACPMFTDDRKYQLKCRAGA